MTFFRIARRMLAKRDRQRAAAREAERVATCLNPTRERTADPATASLNDDGLPHVRVAETRFVLGTRLDRPDELVTLERREVVASHSITYGATGAGKGMAWLLLLDQELRRLIDREERGLAPDSSIIILEPKHDLAPSFLALLADRLRRTREDVRARLLERLTTLNPLGRYVVPLPILKPEPDVSPELHATALSGLIGRLSGSPFGPKQRPWLDVILLVFILANIQLPEGVELLNNWERLRALGMRSTSPVARGFFEDNLRAPAGSLDGIRARLLRLVFAPNLREMFSASEGLDFDDLLRPGRITVVDAGGTTGEEDMTSFLAGLVMLKLGRAIRRRSNGASPVLFVIDEFQRVLQGDGDVAEQTAAFLEMARSRGVALHLLTQTPAAIATASPRLLRSIHTNTAVELLGATDDPSALAGILPVTGRRPRPPGAPWEASPSSPWLSRDEELRQLVEETQALPPRSFWVRAKRRAPKATLVQTLTFRLPESRNDDLALQIARGRLGHLPAPSTPRQARAVVLQGAPVRRPRGLR